MTVQTETMPDWETRFFAGIMLEAAENKAKEAEREHEKASNSYIASLESKDRTKVIVARTTLSHSLKRYHAAQRTLKTAKGEVAKTSIITFHQ
jgi:hypothetical protein